MPRNMDEQTLKDDLFYLAGYLLTSAAGLYHEPGEYGIHRLLDAANRLLGTMQAHGLSDPFLERLRDEVEEEMASSMDAERQQATIERLVMEYTDQVERRIAGR